MAITLLRHTTPDVDEGLCYGQLDIPLAASFDHEARRLLKTLSRPDCIMTSRLSRCRRLAERIAQRFNCDLEVSPAFMEMDFGRWEGRRWAEIPRDQLDAWANDFFTARPHAGESVSMVHERVTRALKKLEERPGQTLIVTHAGVIKCALANGQTPNNFGHSVPYGHGVSLV
ncbi:MAG: alpha-ribazole phosphatase [Sphingomonadales bacterium]